MFIFFAWLAFRCQIELPDSQLIARAICIIFDSSDSSSRWLTAWRVRRLPVRTWGRVGWKPDGDRVSDRVSWFGERVSERVEFELKRVHPSGFSLLLNDYLGIMHSLFLIVSKPVCLAQLFFVGITAYQHDVVGVVHQKA